MSEAIEAHGGDLLAWAEWAGCAPEALLDFSINLNPLGPPLAALRAARDSLRRPGRYPDPQARPLVSRLAALHDVPGDCIATGAGSCDLLFRLAQWQAGRPVLATVPSFSEYAAAARAAGCPVITHPVGPPPARDLGVALAFLCQPNSPGGEHYEPAVLDAWLGWARDTGARLVVDEAFVELAWPPLESWVGRAARDPALIAVRSLTKTYACPWLRMGYLVATPPIARQVAELIPPWSLSGPAQAFALAALEPSDYLARTGEAVRQRRALLERGLAALPFAAHPSRAPFVCAELRAGPGSARALQQRLVRRHHILVRHCGSFAGLEQAERLRFGLRRRTELRQLLDALAEETAALR